MNNELKKKITDLLCQELEGGVYGINVPRFEKIQKAAAEIVAYFYPAVEPGTIEYYCGRCGKPAPEGKTEGDYCHQFHDPVKKGSFCCGKITSGKASTVEPAAETEKGSGEVEDDINCYCERNKVNDRHSCGWYGYDNECTRRNGDPVNKTIYMPSLPSIQQEAIPEEDVSQDINKAWNLMTVEEKTDFINRKLGRESVVKDSVLVHTERGYVEASDDLKGGIKKVESALNKPPSPPSVKTGREDLPEDFYTGPKGNEDRAYPIGGYAPGNYICKCSTCGKKFMGDKRAVQCEPCAEEMTSQPSPTEQEGEFKQDFHPEHVEFLSLMRGIRAERASEIAEFIERQNKKIAAIREEKIASLQSQLYNSQQEAADYRKALEIAEENIKEAMHFSIPGPSYNVLKILKNRIAEALKFSQAPKQKDNV